PNLHDYANAPLRIMLSLAQPSPTQTAAASIDATKLSSGDAKKKADEVLAGYVAALGGRAALEKISSRVGKGNFEVSGIAMSGPVETYAKAPNLMLMVLQMPGQETFKDGFDGRVGWEQNPDDGIT